MSNDKASKPIDNVADFMTEMPMSTKLSEALQVGLTDIQEGRDISLEEHNTRHLERRQQWIRSHKTQK